MICAGRSMLWALRLTRRTRRTWRMKLLAAIASAQESGAISDVAGRADPFDVMAVVIAMSMAWSPVSNVYAATADEPAETLGEGLSLPPRFESLREELGGVLTPLPDTRAWRPEPVQ